MATATEQPAEIAPLGEHEVFTGKDGKPRLRIKGRRGFPITMLDGETPAIAWERYQRKRAENARTGTTKKPPATSSPADEADRLVGIAKSIANKLPPPTNAPSEDPPPRRKNTPASPLRPKVTDKQLGDFLEEAIAMCAIPFGMPVPDPNPANAITMPDGHQVPGFKPRCRYCRDHFVQTSGPASVEFVKLAENSPGLRRVLERGYHAWGYLTMGGVIGMLVLKPAMHHLAPEPVLEGLGPIVGVPPREPSFPKPPKIRKRKGGRKGAITHEEPHAEAHPTPSGPGAPGHAAGSGPAGTAEFSADPLGAQPHH